MIIVGVCWLTGTFALDYPAKTAAVDNLTKSVRPVFTDAALAQSSTDLNTTATFADDFSTKAAPALAQQLGVPPAQFLASLGTQYPAVGAGLAQQPRIQAYFESVHRTMIEQQRNFHRADAIPTTYLPNRTVHWLFVVIGAAAIALPAIIGRIDVLVTAVSANIHNFRLGDSTPTKDLATTNVEWQFVIPAALLIIAGAVGTGAGRRPSSGERTLGWMTDEKGPDDKVLTVPATDPRLAQLRDISDLPEFDRLEIQHFFEVYKALELGKNVAGDCWAGRAEAEREIAASVRRLAAAGTP